MSKRRFVNQLRRSMWCHRAFKFLLADTGGDGGQEYNLAVSRAICHSKTLFKDAKKEAERAADEGKGWAVLFTDRPGECRDDQLDEAATLMVCADLAEIGMEPHPLLVKLRPDSHEPHFVVIFGWEPRWQEKFWADKESPPYFTVRELG